jgi:N-acetylglucosamine-6-phosphate deacetylase
MTKRLGVRAALVDGRLVDGDIDIADARVNRVGLLHAGSSGIAVPGLVDVHINGFAGVDFLVAGPDDYAAAGAALAATGVTAYQPTFIAAPTEDLRSATLAVAEAMSIGAPGARILGVHLEGPFLAATHRGIHPKAALRPPDRALLDRLLGAGPVSMVTLAPELPGALELVELLVERGIAVSCGHTDATAAEADAAFDRGARAVTHLFNAMRPLRHRDPGIVGAALVRDDVIVQMIVDHHHLAPQTAAIAWRAARSRICIVTDAISAAGIGDGDYRVGPVNVRVTGGEPRLPDGTLAGNVGTILDGVRNLHRLGATLEEAVAAATAAPARLLGRDDVGILRPDASADILVLDDRLEVLRVLIGGRELAGDAGGRALGSSLPGSAP